MRRTDHPEPARSGQPAAVVADGLRGVLATVVTVAMVAIVLVAGSRKVLVLWLRRQRRPAERS